MRVAPDDPLAADVRALLEEHLADMRRISPPESVHALDPAALASPDVLFLAARGDDGALLGCGALQRIDAEQGEVKSMRTAAAERGRGVAAAVLAEIIAAARRQGLRRLSLETGAEAFFDPAARLYARAGFVPTGPFGGYTDDSHSRYATLVL